MIREELDPYRLELTNNAVIEAVGPAAGMDILDMGCGEGYLTRLMSRAGARVVGVDACERFTEAARAEASAQGLHIEYRFGRAESLPCSDGSFDVVLANHVLNELPDLEEPVQEVGRVLKIGGRFVALMLHPCFYRANFTKVGELLPITPGEYFGDRELSQHFMVSGLKSPAPVRMWLRPLEAYVSAITRAGMVITSLSEPHPSTAQLDQGWWNQNFKVPMFVLLVGQKL